MSVRRLVNMAAHGPVPTMSAGPRKLGVSPLERSSGASIVLRMKRLMIRSAWSLGGASVAISDGDGS